MAKIENETWRPIRVQFDKETWESLRGKEGLACIVDSSNKVIAVVWSPDDSIDDIHYAAAIGLVPKMLEMLRDLWKQEPEVIQKHERFLEKMMEVF